MAGRSARAPERYRRHYYITDHSLERFAKRFKAPKEQKDWPLAGDNIGHILDAATHDAVRSKFYEDLTDTDGRPVRVVALSPLLHVELWAVIKENTPRHSDFDAAIITVFDKALYDKWQSERWSQGKGFGTLAEKLKPMLSLIPPQQPVILLTVTPPLPTPPPEVYVAKLELVDPRIITWVCQGRDEQVKLEKAAALVHLEKLRNEPDVHSVQLWKPVKTKIVIEEE